MTLFDESSSTNFEDVGDFHLKFNLPVALPTDDIEPRPVDGELMDFRRKFLQEELDEFIDGLEMGNHAMMFDALLDLVYVAMGTAHLCNYPWQEGWERVQQANMSKIRALKDGSDSVRGSSFDVVKPPGFVPPDIEGLLHEYGWRFDEL